MSEDNGMPFSPILLLCIIVSTRIDTHYLDKLNGVKIACAAGI